MAETSTSDGPATGADFDMMSALDWKDGIATLPGRVTFRYKYLMYMMHKRVV